MQDSKIPKLNNEELNALIDVKFFELKHSVMAKSMKLLSILEIKLKEEAAEHNLLIPDEVLQVKSKISKGENYQGLPYLVLDYPRFFKNNNVFAFRSMFWWGNYFTFTLHISGAYLSHFIPILRNNLSKLNLTNTFISISDNEWVHHIDQVNYLSLDNWEKDFITEEYFNRIKFIKLVRKLELSDWEKVPDFGFKTFKLFLKILN